jgi:hypothetical protein
MRWSFLPDSLGIVPLHELAPRAVARRAFFFFEESVCVETREKMPLSFCDRLAMLMPSSLFYRRRIAEEARTGEPELHILADLVVRGGTAIDVGANQGFFAYALGEIADRVIAFEPNPDQALFARRMLRGRAIVHEIALSNETGRMPFFVPISERGTFLHLAGSLKRTHSQFTQDV